MNKEYLEKIYKYMYNQNVKYRDRYRYWVAHWKYKNRDISVDDAIKEANEELEWLDSLDISTHTYKAVHSSGIFTKNDLLNLFSNPLIKPQIKGVGKKGMEELQKIVNEYQQK